MKPDNVPPQITDLAPLFGQRVRPLIMAGPCSAESESQTLATAESLAAGGVKIFRAGVWKPRTKPGSFEGCGIAALPWLEAVKERTGMLTATEIASAEHLHLALSHGIDGVWLGARTSANPFAVQAIADAIAALPSDIRENLTILIKNPVNPDLELWIGAIERIYASGVRRLGAVHRGFSSYGEKYYRNSPVWHLALELRRRLPQLPLLCDPSHIGGRRELVAPLMRRAMSMDYDGLIVECHCNPKKALSDSAQQLTPAEFTAILRTLPQKTISDSGDTRLEEYRRQIDLLDDELIDLLTRRMEISREIGELKRQSGMQVVQTGRYKALMERFVAAGEARGMQGEFVRTILAAMHEESVRQQLEHNAD